MHKPLDTGIFNSKNIIHQIFSSIPMSLKFDKSTPLGIAVMSLIYF